MKVKIETFAQINQLEVGRQITRFPCEGIPKELFDETRPSEIEIYDIKSSDVDHKVIGLVLARESRIQFASPGDITKIFISPASLIKEGLWWI